MPAKAAAQTKSPVCLPINQSVESLLTIPFSAVLPYFPYSRQSKKKSHRGAITARMLANLLHVAGVNHIITIDLHASQMQGFFRCPVDNLHAEPLIARWIRHNVPNWQQAVCVSKNAGGTKRVTSLADALKLNFGMVTTDRRRGGNGMSTSMILPNKPVQSSPLAQNGYDHDDANTTTAADAEAEAADITAAMADTTITTSTMPEASPTSPRPSPLLRASTTPASTRSRYSLNADDVDTIDYTDELARDVLHSRLVHGHIVPDDYPSPSASAMSQSQILSHSLGDIDADPMTLSRTSAFFTGHSTMDALGGTGDAAPSSDEEDDSAPSSAPHKRKEQEKLITLVGDVRGRTVFLVDDMIDKSSSWIAAAETVRKRGGAREVYVVATHGLFGGGSLEELEACECVDWIVVTNSFPITAERRRGAKKLVVLELAGLLSEAVRRNHYGESISALFQHGSD